MTTFCEPNLQNESVDTILPRKILYIPEIFRSFTYDSLWTALFRINLNSVLCSYIHGIGKSHWDSRADPKGCLAQTKLILRLQPIHDIHLDFKIIFVHYWSSWLHPLFSRIYSSKPHLNNPSEVEISFRKVWWLVSAPHLSDILGNAGLRLSFVVLDIDLKAWCTSVPSKLNQNNWRLSLSNSKPNRALLFSNE